MTTPDEPTQPVAFPSHPEVGALYRWTGEHWQAIPETPDLDPRPWSITRGAGGFTTGSRVQDAYYIDNENVRFVFDPRDAYTQEPDQYPEDVYGPVREHTTPEQEAVVGTLTGKAVQEGMRPVQKPKQVDSDINSMRTNALSLLSIADLNEGNRQLLREIVQALAYEASRDADVTDDEIYAERQNQISKGYSARHDDEHGIRHLLLWAIQYGKQRKAVESLALIRAALESMARKGQDL